MEGRALSSGGTTVDLGDAPRAASAELFRRLGELGIVTRTVAHEAVFTVAGATAVVGDLPGAHCKNLFLHDRKGRAWLVVARADAPLDLKTLARTLGAARLSFGSADLLRDTLGVIPGAVSPFAALNDRRGTVTVVVQRDLLAEDTLNFHPLDNRMTTAISPADLVRFLEATAHPPLLADL